MVHFICNRLALVLLIVHFSNGLPLALGRGRNYPLPIECRKNL